MLRCFLATVFLLLGLIADGHPFASFTESTIVLFCDTDQMMQLPLPVLENTMRRMLRNFGSMPSVASNGRIRGPSAPLPIIFAAEDYCFPAGLYNMSRTASSWVGRRKSSQVAAFDEPICLNSGNYFGTPLAMINLLNRTCPPCSKGLDAANIHRSFQQSYTELISPRWFFDDQVEMAKLYVSGLNDPMSVAPLSIHLDTRQELFMPLSEFDPASIERPPLKVKIRSDGLFQSRLGTTPTNFVHFNGCSKAWIGLHSATTLAGSLRSRYTERTNDVTVAKLHHHVRDHITFVSPRFERVHNVSLQEACNAGMSLHDGVDVVKATRILDYLGSKAEKALRTSAARPSLQKKQPREAEVLTISMEDTATDDEASTI